MSSRHISDQQRALYVIDGLAAEAREELEQHVMSCPACAAALAEEARFELLLQELPRLSPVETALPFETARPAVALPRPFADADPGPARASKRRRWAMRSVWGLAAAAALLFWMRLTPVPAPQPIHLSVPESPESLVSAEQSLYSMPPGPELLACNLENARQCAFAPPPGAVVGTVSLLSAPLPEMASDNGGDDGDSMCDMPEAVTCSGHVQVCGQ